MPRFRETARLVSRKSDVVFRSELTGLIFSARLHQVPCSCTLCWEPVPPPRPLLLARLKASGIGFTTPVWRHTHSLNLLLTPGTRKAARGRAGCARYSRPFPREQGTLATRSVSMSDVDAASIPGPRDSPSGAWEEGSRQVGGGRDDQTGQTEQGLAGWLDSANCNRVPGVPSWRMGGKWGGGGDSLVACAEQAHGPADRLVSQGWV